MIDRDTAIQWAKEAFFEPSFISMGYFLARPEHIQTLITRATNEAYERAAQHAWEHYMKACEDQRSDPRVNDLDPWASFNSIRSLKEST